MILAQQTQLVCTVCQRVYAADEPVWRCTCGGLLDIKIQLKIDLAAVEKRKPSMWRYREALPLDTDQHIVSFDEGFTPLLPLSFSGREILFKLDMLFPSGSYKDRGASLLISKAKELGIQRVVEDSSGNAGAAMATYCARAGMACDIYVPESTSLGKLEQIAATGAHLHKIPGTRQDTAEAVLDAAQHTYYASHSWNPFFFHGTKTCAYELCEQMGWQTPDSIVVPVGNGTLLLGLHIGFEELFQAGIISSKPQFIAVQAAACAPLAQRFLGEAFDNASGETLAEGIAIANPIRGEQILRAVQNSRGTFVAVEELEILDAWKQLAQMGLYVEPTAAATVAGLTQVQNRGTLTGAVVVILTGHGLKSAGKSLAYAT